MPLLGYHIRLAYRSLIRDRAFSAAMVLCLALSASIWGAAAAHYLRLHERPSGWSPKAHAVHAQRPSATWQGNTLLPGEWRRQALKLSWPEYEALKAAAAVPVSANYRAWLLVDERGHMVRRPGRFADDMLWDLFPRRFAFGGPWSAEQERSAAAVVVLSRALNQRVFGGQNSVGRDLLVEGRPFRVVGVLADPQKFTPIWDMSSQGGDEEQLLVPLSLAASLKVRPEFLAPHEPLGKTFDDVLHSTARALAVWAAVRPEEAPALEQRLPPLADGGRLRLLSVDSVFDQFPRPPDATAFFVLLCALVLIMGGFSMTRLLFAKSVARRREVGVHRALGASRSSLFLRTMIETVMVSAAGAVIALPLLMLLLWFFNVRHLTNDIPLMLTPRLMLAATLPSFGVGLLAGLYPAWRVARTRPTVYLSRV